MSINKFGQTSSARRAQQQPYHLPGAILNYTANGDIDAAYLRISNVETPSALKDVANKKYVDDVIQKLKDDVIHKLKDELDATKNNLTALDIRVMKFMSLSLKKHENAKKRLDKLPLNIVDIPTS